MSRTTNHENMSYHKILVIIYGAAFIVTLLYNPLTKSCLATMSVSTMERYHVFREQYHFGHKCYQQNPRGGSVGYMGGGDWGGHSGILG